MDVITAIKSRKSVRDYLDRPVEKEALGQVLEAARLAPSASNRQEWVFVVVQDHEKRQRMMAAASGQKFVGQAPVVIACCAAGPSLDHVMKCGHHCYPIDVAIAIDHMTLAAVERGLGTCWVGAFDETEARSVLGIPDDVRVVELLALGYPADGSVKQKIRKDIDEIVRYDTW